MPYLALRHADYRRLIVSQFFSLVGSQMQVVAINWHVYLLTRSPLALGFVGLTRVVGRIGDRHVGLGSPLRVPKRARQRNADALHSGLPTRY